MYTGPANTEQPILVNRTTVLSVRDTNTATFREPLFGLDSGMATYGVQRIFNPQRWYSILLQDFYYNFDPSNIQTLNNNLLSVIEDANGKAIKLDPNHITLKRNRINMKIRSRDALDQKMKALTKIEKRYPLIERHTASADNSNTAIFSIYSERGVPDYLFIFAERQHDGIVEAVVGFPIISGVDFYGRTNNTKSLCNYLFDEHEIWHATRRNSNIGCDLEVLRNVGGVLLSKEDLGTLERDEFSSKDCFDYDIKVLYKNETSDAPVIALDVTITLVTIFEDAIFLKGPNGQMTFAEEKRY